MEKRLRRFALHAAVPVLVGFALAAGAILPRWEYYTRSNMAEGYVGELAWAANLGGWDHEATVLELLGHSLYYLGGATLALAVAALLVVRQRSAAPYFALLALAALDLAQREDSLLHRLLYAVLPRFEELHRHWPERDMVVFLLGPALLAGATVHALGRWRGRSAPLVVAALLPLLIGLRIEERVAPVHPYAWRAAFVVAVGVLLVANLPGPATRRLIPVLLVLTIFLDLREAGQFNLANGLYGGFHKVDLTAYYEPSGAAAFLRARQAEEGEPARFFGYDPGIHPGTATPELYRYFFPDPRTGYLLLNNRATLLGLQDVQGYNPIQPQRYVEYMRALNGRIQEYHEANVYPGGLTSPLLDLLNARYIVVPATVPPSRPDLAYLVGQHPTVYEDDRVRVLENREALPRAWIVHEARRVAPGEALPLLASGSVDPRRVALLEEEPPHLAAPADPDADRAVVVMHEADHLRVRVRTDAPGLLVLSETADPAWRAEVDGEPAPVLTADYVLRAVPVPAGEHTVELRYELVWLRLGTAVSLVGFGGVVLLWGAAGWRRWGARPRQSQRLARAWLGT